MEQSENGHDSQLQQPQDAAYTVEFLDGPLGVTMDKDSRGTVCVTKVSGAAKDLGVTVGDKMLQVAGTVLPQVGGDVKSVAKLIREAARPLTIKFERRKMAVQVLQKGGGDSAFN